MDHVASCHRTAPVGLPHHPGCPARERLALPSQGTPAGMVHWHSASGGTWVRKVGLRLVLAGTCPPPRPAEGPLLPGCLLSGSGRPFQGWLMAGLHFHVNGPGRQPGKLVNKPPAPWGRLCGVLTQPHSLGLAGLAVAMAPCMASWATANPFPGPFILAVPPPGWSLVTWGCPTRLVSLPGSEEAVNPGPWPPALCPWHCP